MQLGMIGQGRMGSNLVWFGGKMSVLETVLNRQKQPY